MLERLLKRESPEELIMRLRSLELENVKLRQQIWSLQRREKPQEPTKSLKALELENVKLRQQIWGLRYRGTIPIGITLACIAGVMMFLSYLYTSLILTFIGLGLALVGLLIFYVTPSRYVREEVLHAIPLSMIKAIDSLIVTLGYKGRTIFLNAELAGNYQGYIFVPRNDISGIPSDEKLTRDNPFCDSPEGISMMAPSQSLVEFFEKELSINFDKTSMRYLQENLPKLLIEDLRIIDELSIESDGNTTKTVMVGTACAELCEMISRQTHTGNHLGCPLCSAIALVIGKITGKPVTIEDSNVKNKTITTTYRTLDFY